jgi:DNA-binding transcriptional MerR regulator
MTQLQKISDVAAHFGTTTRTLRYYEEIGLLESRRNDFSPIRFYDDAALRRLEQILLLRRLELSLPEIQQILTTQDLQVAVAAFAGKVKELETEIGRLESLREIVSAFLTLLKERGYNAAGGLGLLEAGASLLAQPVPTAQAQKEKVREALSMTQESTLSQVRIVELKPMRVANYRAVSASPEEEAWAVMNRWVEEAGLTRLATTRYFGFDNPSPTPGKPEYGYEVWVTLPEGVEPPAPIQTKQFGGGLYAVTTATGIGEIFPTWQRLVAWLNAHDQYAPAQGICLEETVTPYGWPIEKVQLDLYEPIKVK